MIKYNELLYSFGKPIKDNIKNCKLRLKDNQEDIKEPTFFIEVRPLSSNSYKYYNEKLINVSITFADEFVDNEKLNDVLNDLEKIFDAGIKVKDTFLMFTNKSIDIDDSCLTMNLTMNYKDNKNTTDENNFYSKMIEELYFDI